MLTGTRLCALVETPTIVSFSVLVGLSSKKKHTQQARELKEHDLLAYNTASPEIRAELWAWVVVRCLDLLDRFGVETIMVSFYVDSSMKEAHRRTNCCLGNGTPYRPELDPHVSAVAPPPHPPGLLRAMAGGVG